MNIQVEMTGNLTYAGISDKGFLVTVLHIYGGRELPIEKSAFLKENYFLFYFDLHFFFPIYFFIFKIE